MSRFRKYEIIEQSPSFFIHESSSLLTPTTISLDPFCPSSSFLIEKHDHIDFPLNFMMTPTAFNILPPFYDDFDAITCCHVKHHHRRVGFGSELYMQRLCDRVSDLELGIEQFVNMRNPKIGERKYSWTTEIKSPEKNWLDRKYKWSAEIKHHGKKFGVPVDKSYKFTAEIKGKGVNYPIKRTCKFESLPGNAGEIIDLSGKNVYYTKNRKPMTTRLVEITEPSSNHGAVVLRQAFARRVEKIRGKRKELSLQEASVLIQRTFRGYLIRRSQVLRALRELAIAKTKLKEIRSRFSNFSYRRRVARDNEERQRFTEKITVLLLTVDTIQGADLMVRAAKRSIVYELEAMLEAVDPVTSGRFLSTRRRAFDMPDGVIQKELAAGVAQIVQMIDEDGCM